MERASTIFYAIPGRSGVPEVVRQRFPAAADGGCFGLSGAFAARGGNYPERSPAESGAVVWTSTLRVLSAQTVLKDLFSYGAGGRWARYS